MNRLTSQEPQFLATEFALLEWELCIENVLQSSNPVDQIIGAYQCAEQPSLHNLPFEDLPNMSESQISLLAIFSKMFKNFIITYL